MPELDNKVAIVTGVGRIRGLGRAVSESLAQAGCDVVVTGTGRDPSTFPPEEQEIGWRGIESVADSVRAEGRRALPLVVDVTSASSIAAMVENTLSEFGRIDILINNAASPRGPDRRPLVDLPEDIFRTVMDVKVLGTYLCCQAIIPQMVSQGGGKIINVSTVLAKDFLPNTSAYASANAAVHAMTAVLSREVSRHNINVNCVCPGTLDTSRNDVLPQEALNNIANNIPMGRLGTPEEVASFITYLCTPAADWIQGQSMNINGGVTAA